MGSNDSIRLVQIVPVDSPTLTFPGYVEGAAAAVAAVNDAGGINGRLLEVTHCDDRNEPTAAAECAQDAVADGVVARVSDLSTQGAQIMPILEAAGIPDIGTSPALPIDTSSPIAFPLNVGTYLYAGQGGLARAQFPDARTALFLWTDVPGREARAELARASAEEAGLEVIDDIVIPANTADLSPVLAQIAQRRPDVILGAVSANDQIKYWSAATPAGIGDIPQLTTAAGFTADVLRAGGEAAANTYFFDSYPLATGNAEGVGEYVQDLEQFGEGATPNPDSWKAYVGVMVLAEVLRSIQGDITAPAVLEALNTTSGLDVLYLEDLDFTGPGPFAAAPRITVTDGYLFGNQNGELTDTGVVYDVG